MRAIIVSCVFWPEPVTSARTSAQLAEQLSKGGWWVRVITTFPHRPAGKVYPGYQKRLFSHEYAQEGYSRLRCFSFFSPRSNMVSRFLENFSFGVGSGIALLIGARPDVVYANTWPIFAQGLLWLTCRIRNIPIVLSIQDLYPESLVVQRRLHHDSWIFRALRFIDTFIARHSDAIVVISEQFRQWYIRERGLSPEKIFVIPNWVEDALEVGDYSKKDIRSRHHIPENAFLVVYGGNIGFAAGVDRVIQAFEHLADKERIYLLIAGDGPMLKHCRALSRAGNNRHIVFHHPWFTDETSKVLSAADLLILPTRGKQSLVSVPSKLISYMLAERPILALGQAESELARIIQTSNSGWILPPDSIEELSRKIAEISVLPKNELQKRGKAGRNFAQQHFSKSVNLPEVIKILEMVSARGRHDTSCAAG